MATPSTKNVLKTPNLFLHVPPHGPDARVPTSIFFITGNPGLISYYHEFLSLLCQPQLQSDADISRTTLASTSNPAPDSCVVAGFSLGGFDLPSPRTTAATADSPTPETKGNDKVDEWTDHELNDLLYPPNFQKKSIYGLQDQIELCYARLNALAEKVRQQYTSKSSNAKHTDGEYSVGQERVTGQVANVILIGHSVGAYIALEMVRSHHAAGNSSNSTSRFTITTSLLLTPTILNISHSPSGRFATPLLSILPFLPSLAQSSTWALTSLLPTTRLHWLVSKVTGMRAGSGALEATVAFLSCPGAVRQALWLAGQEMRTIGGNEWGEEVWGVLKGDGGRGGSEGERQGGESRVRERYGTWKAPKLCLWFATGDHWVADITREEIKEIVERWGGEEGDRPEVIVDEDEGLVHAWCIEQSEMVAVRVRSWLRDALSRGMI